MGIEALNESTYNFALFFQEAKREVSRVPQRLEKPRSMSISHFMLNTSGKFMIPACQNFHMNSPFGPYVAKSQWGDPAAAIITFI